MNLVSDVLLLVASVAIGYAVVKSVVNLSLFELRQVVVTTPLGQVTGAQLEYAAVSSMRGNFFTVDLEKARESFEKLPWVRRAQVRRRWPATVEVSLEEQAAVAYWKMLDTGDMRLVNTHGEVFDAASNAVMPVYTGPSERAGDMLEAQHRWDEMLQPIGRHIVSMNLSPRSAWQLHLDDGLVLEMGRDQTKAPVDDRLRKFVAAYPAAQEKLQRRWAVADLRYPAGFAVRMTNEKASQDKPNKAGKTAEVTPMSKGKQ
ncbi:cell division protein FtsQ/DivIB [Uliginosibacterium sp. H3]|uniref:Cell division protein FtsQ n=1 Tax=Uliginosibacterium silvisoli TaxID=3114758 RepID=A0ABU6K357_9RHOO|nr:cell division protein FtsQ/DivIB [Uliginosibacterium sp. H3]